MLEEIFDPKSIVIIGASNNQKKWGGRILKNIIVGGYTGYIYPINPKEITIQGLTSYSSISEISADIDLAIIVIPSSQVIPVVEECGKKGVKGLIVITAGFAETGNKVLEEELHNIVKRYNTRMIGANTLGIANNSVHLNASIMQDLPKVGNISFISQSGTMGLAIVEWAKEKGIGLSKVISTGNKTDIDDVDLLQCLNNDPDTKVIAIYAESIKRGREFLEAARHITKPIIVLKVGRSKKGAKAAFSHTSSMAGADEIYSAAFKQAGVIRVDTLDDLFDAILVFSTQPLPKGNGVGILSNGGGAGIIAADECERCKIELPDLSKETIEQIKKVLPGYASAANPVDTAAVSTFETYDTIAGAFINNPEMDSILSIYVHDSVADSVPSAEAIATQITKKPIVVCSMGGRGKEEGIRILEESGIPVFSSPDRAVKALSYLLQHKKFLEEVKL